MCARGKKGRRETDTPTVGRGGVYDKLHETIRTLYAVHCHFVKMQNKTANAVGESCIIYS